MKKTFASLAGSLVLLTLAAPSFARHGGAGDGAPRRGQGVGIQHRIENQRKRIEHGVEKGRLTEQEAAQLKQNLDQIEAQKTQALQDGKLSKEERKGLKQELQKSSGEIREMKQTGSPSGTPSGTPAGSPPPAAPTATPSS